MISLSYLGLYPNTMWLMVLLTPLTGDVEIKWESVLKSIMNSKALASHKPVTYKREGSRADGGNVTQIGGKHKPPTSWVSVKARRTQERLRQDSVWPVFKRSLGESAPPGDHCHNCMLRPSLGQTAHLSCSYPTWNYESKGQVGFQRIYWRFRLDGQTEQCEWTHKILHTSQLGHFSQFRH